MCPRYGPRLFQAACDPQRGRPRARLLAGGRLQECSRAESWMCRAKLYSAIFVVLCFQNAGQYHGAEVSVYKRFCTADCRESTEIPVSYPGSLGEGGRLPNKGHCGLLWSIRAYNSPLGLYCAGPIVRPTAHHHQYHMINSKLFGETLSRRLLTHRVQRPPPELKSLIFLNGLVITPLA